MYSVNWRCTPSSPCGATTDTSAYFKFNMDTTSTNSATYCNYQKEFTVKLVGIPMPFFSSLAILIGVAGAFVSFSLFFFWYYEKLEEQRQIKEMEEMNGLNEFEFNENIFA
jgi:hypothetical protein